MKIYESAQDYLERILMLSKKSNVVRSIDIASDMKVTKQSVSRAMKNLRVDGYINVDENGYITLTSKGLEVANHMYERHTTITKFLTTIGVPVDLALKDACKMEHDISNETFSAIKELLVKLEQE
ncbi:MAG: metal-dependent transcriptional regulator [Bacilli bacterium]|nr:metal-dependent transcriptional regulator [Bacilli bacterium]